MQQEATSSDGKQQQASNTNNKQLQQQTTANSKHNSKQRQLISKHYWRALRNPSALAAIWAVMLQRVFGPNMYEVYTETSPPQC